MTEEIESTHTIIFQDFQESHIVQFYHTVYFNQIVT